MGLTRHSPEGLSAGPDIPNFSNKVGPVVEVHTARQRLGSALSLTVPNNHPFAAVSSSTKPRSPRFTTIVNTDGVVDQIARGCWVLGEFGGLDVDCMAVCAGRRRTLCEQLTSYSCDDHPLFLGVKTPGKPASSMQRVNSNSGGYTGRHGRNNRLRNVRRGSFPQSIDSRSHPILFLMRETILSKLYILRAKAQSPPRFCPKSPH